MSSFIKKAKKWLSFDYDKKTRDRVKYLISNNLDELRDCFYKNIDFGTGGIRGIMDVGTNRINKYTVSILGLGLVEYLKNKYYYNKRGLLYNISVVIGYDIRKNSKYFAMILYYILHKENINVYIFNSFISTPELSYSTTYMKCQVGVMVTGSHNPKNHNGCKVYNSDGSQMVYPEDKLLSKIINNIIKKGHKMINFNIKEHDINFCSNKHLTDSFISDCIKYSTYNNIINKNIIKIVFTALHGTSSYLMPKIFEISGFNKVFLVKNQCCVDSNFSTIQNPNPEDKNSFFYALKVADYYNADIILSTDCDSDRIGLAVRDNANNIVILNGNQINTILIYYILNFLNIKNILNNKYFIVSTIVSSDIFLKLADYFNIRCLLSLTGFKWIVQLIKECKYKGYSFIAGGEESFGFMIGDFIKDKNAFSPMLLIAEIANYYKLKYNSDIFTQLIYIYNLVGYYKEYQYSLFLKGYDGVKKMNYIMDYLRNNIIDNIGGHLIHTIEDYKNQTIINTQKEVLNKIFLPKSNILIYRLNDNSKICIRPSGTESKIKFYFSVNCKLNNTKKFKDFDIILQKKIISIFNAFIKLINLL